MSLNNLITEFEIHQENFQCLRPRNDVIHAPFAPPPLAGATIPNRTAEAAREEWLLIQHGFRFRRSSSASDQVRRFMQLLEMWCVTADTVELRFAWRDGMPQKEQTYRFVQRFKFYMGQRRGHAKKIKMLLRVDEVAHWHNSHEFAFAESGALDLAMPPRTQLWLALLLEPRKPSTEEPEPPSPRALLLEQSPSYQLLLSLQSVLVLQSLQSLRTISWQRLVVVGNCAVS